MFWVSIHGSSLSDSQWTEHNSQCRDGKKTIFTIKEQKSIFQSQSIQFSFLSNVGDGSTSIFDLCGWGAISFMLLKIFPEILIAQVKTARLVVIPRNS